MCQNQSSAEGTVATAEIDGARIHYEVRGQGRPVLMISGATGDAGHFAAAAEFLAEGFRVVTYDRRGNSRSRAGAVQTSLDQQADDAAALIENVTEGRAAVFGSSGGAVIALKLALRRPEVASRVVIHEPPFVPVVPNPEVVAHELQGLMEESLKANGPRGTMELFVRMNAGDAEFERLDPSLRERMLGNAEWFFGQEFPMFTSWVPTPEELRGIRVPVRVLAGRENRGVYYHDASAWVARQLGQELVEIFGRHAPYFSDPRTFAAALRELL